MYVKPVSGRRVADPVKGGYLPDIGRKVEPDIYWHRRVLDKDVMVLTDEEGAALQLAEEKRLQAEEEKRQKEFAEAKAKAEGKAAAEAEKKGQK